MKYTVYRNRHGEYFPDVKGKDGHPNGTNAIEKEFYKHRDEYVEITPKGHICIDTVGITEYLADYYKITTPAEISNLEDLVKDRIDCYWKSKGMADAPSLDARRSPK